MESLYSRLAMVSFPYNEKTDGKWTSCGRKIALDPVKIEFSFVNVRMVYRKSLDGQWNCSWNWGYTDCNIEKVIDYENKGCS